MLVQISIQKKQRISPIIKKNAEGNNIIKMATESISDEQNARVPMRLMKLTTRKRSIKKVYSILQAH